MEGLERALQRGRMYREAGADALFIEAVTTEAEAEEAVRAFPGVPLLFNWAEGGVLKAFSRMDGQDMEIAQAGLSALASS